MNSKDNASGSLEGLISIGIVWGVASAVGFAAMAILMIAVDWTVLQGLFAAAIIFFAMGTLLSRTMLNPISGPVEPGSAGVAPRRAQPAPTPDTKPAPTASAPKVPAASKAPASKAKTVVEPPAPAAASAGTQPAKLDAPRDGGADNLKEIKGVGPKLEGLLNSMGFYHFDQIANWTPDEIAWVDENLEGFKGRVTRDEWAKQAKILAAGGDTEFSKRVGDGNVY